MLAVGCVKPRAQIQPLKTKEGHFSGRWGPDLERLE